MIMYNYTIVQLSCHPEYQKSKFSNKICRKFIKMYTTIKFTKALISTQRYKFLKLNFI